MRIIPKSHGRQALTLTLSRSRVHPPGPPRLFCAGFGSCPLPDSELPGQQIHRFKAYSPVDFRVLSRGGDSSDFWGAWLLQKQTFQKNSCPNAGFVFSAWSQDPGMRARAGGRGAAPRDGRGSCEPGKGELAFWKPPGSWSGRPTTHGKLF